MLHLLLGTQVMCGVAQSDLSLTNISEATINVNITRPGLIISKLKSISCKTMMSIISPYNKDPLDSRMTRRMKSLSYSTDYNYMCVKFLIFLIFTEQAAKLIICMRETVVWEMIGLAGPCIL